MKANKNDAKSPQKQNQETNSIVKYFLHGIPLAVVSLVFMYIFSFSLVLTMHNDISEVIGFVLIIGGAYLVIIGGVNNVVTGMVWEIEPSSNIGSFLGQGFLFTLLLSLVDPLLYFVLFTFAATLILDAILILVTFVILSLILGYIGRNVAAEFVSTNYKSHELASVHDRQVTCPYCGARWITGPSELDSAGGTPCPKCGKWIQIADAGASIS